MFMSMSLMPSLPRPIQTFNEEEVNEEVMKVTVKFCVEVSFKQKLKMNSYLKEMQAGPTFFNYFLDYCALAPSGEKERHVYKELRCYLKGIESTVKYDPKWGQLIQKLDSLQLKFSDNC